MKTIFKHLTLFCLCLCLWQTPALAEEEITAEELLAILSHLAEEAQAPPAPAEEEILPARGHVVTSLKKCLDQLDPAEALEVQRKYVKPFQECQARLERKTKKEQQEKVAAGKKGEETQAPATPRNFIRVRPIPSLEPGKKNSPEKSKDKPKETLNR